MVLALVSYGQGRSLITTCVGNTYLEFLSGRRWVRKVCLGVSCSGFPAHFIRKVGVVIALVVRLLGEVHDLPMQNSIAYAVR